MDMKTQLSFFTVMWLSRSLSTVCALPAAGEQNHITNTYMNTDAGLLMPEEIYIRLRRLI